jgi:competence protein ComEC
MATALSTAELPPDKAGLPGSVWRAPLVPAALAVTAGIALDRSVSVPLGGSLFALAGCLLTFVVARLGDARPGLPLVYLTLAGVAFGAAYHHSRRDFYPPDDIGHVAPKEPRPVLVRGVVAEEPRRTTPPATADPLRSRPQGASASATLSLTHLRHRGDWAPVSGLVRLSARGDLPPLHIGDEVEVAGQLSRVSGPSNPGEFDYAGYCRDQGALAQLVIRQAPAGVTRLARGWPNSWRGWLAAVRGWGHEALQRELSSRTGGVASALLLGEGAPMSNGDWDKYKRTGVIHVLAISGQHLVVLVGFLWFALRRLGVRQRHGALLVALCLLAYALLTGGRPAALRAAVAVCAVCGAVVVRRRTLPANLFALSWLVVALLNPTDLVDQGCQLSFLAVAILYWGTGGLARPEPDPLQEAIDAARPAWVRGLRWLGRLAFEAYALTALISLALAPLLAYRTNAVPVAGLLLGPPLTFLASVALFAGFFLLLLAPLPGPLASLPARVVDGSLGACEWLVDRADGWGTHVYVPDIPAWWVCACYLALLGVLTQGPLRVRWRWGVVAGLGWLCVGLLAGAARLPPDELRCTFLNVGHGGCTVLETPDGRTLLYDAGAINGPEVTRRVIAPFLWSRGLRRVDEVFLSHADLDHFNGLPDLLDRFAVGQVSCTPTFQGRGNAAVCHTLAVLHKHRVPLRIVKAGDRLSAGAVTLDVLHPPAKGPTGNENARSMVLLVRHAGHAILLTGDLEGEGMARLLRARPARAAVLMAPHHGTHRVDVAGLARWCRPLLVVSCQGRPRWPARAPAIYTAGGATFWSTHEHGAVTVRSGVAGLVAETFRGQQRLALRVERADGE